jgi:hypothetical protein
VQCAASVSVGSNLPLAADRSKVRSGPSQTFCPPLPLRLCKCRYLRIAAIGPRRSELPLSVLLRHSCRAQHDAAYGALRAGTGLSPQVRTNPAETLEADVQATLKLGFILHRRMTAESLKETDAASCVFQHIRWESDLARRGMIENSFVLAAEGTPTYPAK